MKEAMVLPILYLSMLFLWFLSLIKIRTCYSNGIACRSSYMMWR